MTATVSQAPPQSATQPWLQSASFDLAWILGPPLYSIFIALGFSKFLEGEVGPLPLWVWVVFVLGIDVSHVYSTLFRTYLKSDEFEQNKLLFLMLPLLLWVAGVVLYSISPLLFWRILAYVAVFHFIRQQYGFLRIYSRGENVSFRARWIDGAVIYLATLYPLIFWHASPDRDFHWFLEGDFISQIPAIFERLGFVVYVAAILAYVAKEARVVVQSQKLNVPKNLVVLGTLASWYLGIVYFNLDLIFTITNVVSHGIPYLALIWVYRSRSQTTSENPVSKFRWATALPLFLATLIAFAYLEEALWAGLVWREHLSAFPGIAFLPKLTSHESLSLAVPLLALPQATHYVLDGFIWRLKDPGQSWHQVLFQPLYRNREN